MHQSPDSVEVGLWLYDGFTVGDLRITNVDHHELVRVEHTDVWVPVTATVQFNRQGLPTVELDISYRQHERFDCTSVRVTADGGGRIDARRFESIRLAELINEAVERLAYIERELADDGLVSFARQLLGEASEPDQEAVNVEQIHLGDRFWFPAAAMFVLLPRDEYELYFGNHLRELLRGANHRNVSHLRVAQEYNRAVAKGLDTGRELSDRLDVSLGTANNLSSSARQAGYLPPADPGEPRVFPGAPVADDEER